LTEGIRKGEERTKADQSFRHGVKRMEENFRKQEKEIPLLP
jgi:hypothetical protein